MPIDIKIEDCIMAYSLNGMPCREKWNKCVCVCVYVYTFKYTHTCTHTEQSLS